MTLPIEDYALIGDQHTAALVGRDGSIDWLCLPSFDSGACFAALLGEPRHGRWLLAPAGQARAARRRYRDGTLILETEFETAEGAVRVIDFMPLSNERWDVVRIVEGLRGRVAMRMELIVRFDYGSIVPWVRRPDDTLLVTAGPDTLELHTGGRTARREHDDRGRVRGARGRAHAVRAQLPAVARADLRGGRPGAGARRHREGMARMVRPVHLRRTLARCGGALAGHAQSADLCPHRRHRRGAHDVAAGVPRRHAQLGLSLLLAARRHVHAERAAAHRLSRRRRSRGASGCCGPSPAPPRTCRSATASPERAVSTNTNWAGCPATAAPPRCAWATPP